MRCGRLPAGRVTGGGVRGSASAVGDPGRVAEAEAGDGGQPSVVVRAGPRSAAPRARLRRYSVAQLCWNQVVFHAV